LHLAKAQILLGLAIAFWGLSFCCGCRKVSSAGSVLYANLGLLRLRAGRDPVAGQNLEAIGIGEDVIGRAIKTHDETSVMASAAQFWFLALGVVSYIAWQIYEMWLRTNAISS